MAFKVLTLLIFFTGCLSIKDNSQQSKIIDSSNKSFYYKNSLNLTKREDLYIGDVISNYPNAESITIISSNRGSVSFHPDDLNGKNSINVTYSNEYKILITDGNKSIELIKLR
tara:strand:- start:2196 stop:2534 length:339 start_codon:yes stop_codon:yes gene_type:complete